MRAELAATAVSTEPGGIIKAQGAPHSPLQALLSPATSICPSCPPGGGCKMPTPRRTGWTSLTGTLQRQNKTQAPPAVPPAQRPSPLPRMCVPGISTRLLLCSSQEGALCCHPLADNTLSPSQLSSLHKGHRQGSETQCNPQL